VIGNFFSVENCVLAYVGVNDNLLPTSNSNRGVQTRMDPEQPSIVPEIISAGIVYQLIRNFCLYKYNQDDNDPDKSAKKREATGLLPPRLTALFINTTDQSVDTPGFWSS